MHGNGKRNEIIDMENLFIRDSDLPTIRRKDNPGVVITGRFELLTILQKKGVIIPLLKIVSILNGEGFTKRNAGGQQSALFMSEKGAEQFISTINQIIINKWEDSSVSKKK